MIERRGVRLELVAVGALFAFVAAEIFVTYARLPAHDLYHVSGTGIGGGASRALVFFNFPTALVAIAVLGLVAGRSRLVAVVGIALCAVVLWPGVVSQSNLDARAVNAFPALGVALAAALAGRRRIARPSPWRVADVARAALAATVLVLAVPWLAADLGLSFTGISSAPTGTYPPESDFETGTRSGSSPQCSNAKSLPVRPKPVCTSSTQKRVP